MVTKQDLIDSFKALGLCEGDICLFHSSFKSLGTVENGAQGVIDAFEKVIGKEGTLVAPTLCSVDFSNSYKTWYMDKPSDVGYLTEFFRKQMYVYRSNHPTHSVAARGKKAYELTFEHDWRGPHICPFGEYAFADSSPWVKMERMNAKIVFIGVNMHYNTMKHVVEGRMVEHFLSQVKDDLRREELKGQLKKFGIPQGFWPFYNSIKMQERLDDLGLVKHAECGDAELILVDAKTTNEVALNILIKEFEQWFDEKVCDWIGECLKDV